MDTQKFEKILRLVKVFCIVILVANIINFIINPSFSIMILLRFVLLIVTLIGCNKQKLYGPISGIIYTIFILIFINFSSITNAIFSIIDIFLGILCISLVKYMKK